MKTTIEMPDDLFRRAKAAAALQGLSMKDWLTDILRREVGVSPDRSDVNQTQEQAAKYVIQTLDQLAADISTNWEGPQDALAAVREQRRELGS